MDPAYGSERGANSGVPERLVAVPAAGAMSATMTNVDNLNRGTAYNQTDVSNEPRLYGDQCHQTPATRNIRDR
jgi:hypothetical protein